MAYLCRKKHTNKQTQSNPFLVFIPINGLWDQSMIGGTVVVAQTINNETEQSDWYYKPPRVVKPGELITVRLEFIKQNQVVFMYESRLGITHQITKIQMKNDGLTFVTNNEQKLKYEFDTDDPLSWPAMENVLLTLCSKIFERRWRNQK